MANAGPYNLVLSSSTWFDSHVFKDKLMLDLQISIDTRICKVLIMRYLHLKNMTEYEANFGYIEFIQNT